ncbi:type I-E CRISPR-associated protein Cas7/Cse4/CasC [Rothia mucilaginosa]|uniref:type I-E CRISPR-associated protein Cas7/Cse4/CasC n=1 Tax=Rothia mucilaginosa TaxID=43675 RepID=UPI0026EF8AE1|nr:type I-E CRISPR-associated protein Cas7/Cse4/CasC [Rothia mucilaginosa]
MIFTPCRPCPPSNINRDDTGSPKSAFFGGIQRQRVSSQAWKSVIRRDFEEHLDRSKLGVRTRLVADEGSGTHPEFLHPNSTRMRPRTGCCAGFYCCRKCRRSTLRLKGTGRMSRRGFQTVLFQMLPCF